MGLADRLVWTHSKHGQYTVDSGYKLAKEYQKKKLGDEGTSHRRSAEEKVLWKGIWDMKIKKIIQHFIWRACHDRLPVNANLLKRKVKHDSRCNFCGEEAKSIENVFFPL